MRIPRLVVLRLILRAFTARVNCPAGAAPTPRGRSKPRGEPAPEAGVEHRATIRRGALCYRAHATQLPPEGHRSADVAVGAGPAYRYRLHRHQDRARSRAAALRS